MAETALFLRIDEDRASVALRETAGSLNAAQGEVVLDLSSIRRIDPEFLRALEDLARAAAEKAVKIVLCGINVDVYKVLKLVKLTARFAFMK